jgi:teichuronic acid biosynthesis glycosyltransferase TuaC
MESYTLGLFANMYPAFDGDYRGIFIQHMVRDLEARGITVKKAVKISSSVTGYIPFYWQSLGLARNSSPDILQAEYIPHSSLIPALIRKRNVPLVLKFHGDDGRIFPFKNSLCMSLTRTMVRKSDYILTASEDIRSIIISLGAVPEKISALHSGVDTTFFCPMPRESVRKKLGVQGDATVFLFVGRLHAWKGINEIIAVANRCPDATFVFVGPGTIPSHSENCMFVGSVPPESVRDWYNAADCLLLPTYTDAVPTSVMEAFASGIPAITTDIGGCPEIVENGRNGLLIPVRDADSLFKAVCWMREHPEDRMRMGKNARETVVNRYDHRIQTERLIRIHRGLIR